MSLHRKLALPSIVVSSLLMSATVFHASAMDGVCVKYCDDTNSSGSYDRESYPAAEELGRNINRGARKVIKAGVSAVQGLLEGFGKIFTPPAPSPPPVQSGPRTGSFFNRGGRLSNPGIDMTRPSSSITAYASTGAQLNAAARDQTGCVFGGQGGCKGGEPLDYRVGKIGNMSFNYPKRIPDYLLQKMTGEEKETLKKYVDGRYAAETDLPQAQRAYEDAKANPSRQSEVADLEKRMLSDKKTIDKKNDEIKKLVYRVEIR